MPAAPRTSTATATASSTPATPSRSSGATAGTTTSPTDCPGDPADPFYQGGKCYDGLRNFNQVRPAVFDGGYAFTTYVPGGVAIGGVRVDSAGRHLHRRGRSPDRNGYKIVKEEDKNVDFGDSYTPSLQLLPPVCVGDDHAVPQFLSLFPAEQIEVVGWTAGLTRPLCDRKQVTLANGQNAARPTSMFTDVPRAGRIVGFILNDLANEFNPNTPSFGEKYAPPWLPISIRDYRGTEINRVYSDEFGAYNALVPSTYTANRRRRRGFAPNMLTVVINDPSPRANGDPEAQFNSLYTTFQYTFQYMPGVTTYLDTPVLPIAAFASPATFPVDAEFPDGTPVGEPGEWERDRSMGGRRGRHHHHHVARDRGPVKQPELRPGGEPQLIPRDYGFGAAQGNGGVTIGGVAAVIHSWNATTITAVCAE